MMHSQKTETPSDACAPSAQLRPQEPQAPIVALSAAKRRALIICLQAHGALHKCYGAWKGMADTRISGNTVADLAREGLLIISMIDGQPAAKLTERGSWFARTAANMEAIASTHTAF
jgi:hypothetical protein